jgi:Reverse transcriptase (RNA-dependent DNA polymerase)
MKLEESELWALARNVTLAYGDRQMRPVGKKHRPIDPMFAWAKRLFRMLHRWLQTGKFAHPRAHGGVKGRSCFTSAKEHLGHRYIWMRDAKDCYPSVTPDVFRKEMLALGFPAETGELLALLCTVRGSIPQGSPLSNDALNLFLWRVDQVMASFCGQRGVTYSRIVDDFVMSANDQNAGIAAPRLLEALLAQRGIRINETKRRKVGFQRREEKPLVHNILVHNRRGTTISDEHQTTALAAATRYVAACKSIQPDSLEALASKRRSLVGWIHYCRQAQFSPVLAVRRLLEAGDAVMRRKLRSLALSAHKGKWWVTTKKRNEPRRLAILWRRRAAASVVLKVFAPIGG